eukprot:9394481-Alexandrium_andersonii.AAC.1
MDWFIHFHCLLRCCACDHMHVNRVSTYKNAIRSNIGRRERRSPVAEFIVRGLRSCSAAA